MYIYMYIYIYMTQPSQSAPPPQRVWVYRSRGGDDPLWVGGGGYVTKSDPLPVDR